MSFVSKIIISSNFEAVKEKLLSEYSSSIIKFIPKEVTDEFLMDNAKEVQRESFIAENKEKIIVIMANSFRNEAQNFLLKLFEEPPKNIKFLLVSPSRNLLLATVRSRFICENLK
ncbi:DNA polymerase III subunit delta', partial [Campylobacter avium]